MKRSIVLPVLACLLLLSSFREAVGKAPSAALRLEAVKPDCVWRNILGWFEGASVQSPAELLAKWKAQGGTGASKPIEALIASLNPEMASQIEIAEATRLDLGLDEHGQWTWGLRFPSDDGTLEDLLRAIALTDGGLEPVLKRDGTTIRVERLSDPASALLGRGPDALVLASSRTGLEQLLWNKGPDPGLGPRDANQAGFHLELTPIVLSRAPEPICRRLGIGLTGMGLHSLQGWLQTGPEQTRLEFQSRGSAAPIGGPTLDRAWIDAIPEEAAAAIVVGLDPRPEAWQARFRLADSIEKADPVRAQTAPVRIRLNLLASALGVSLERDVWPCLRGLSAFVWADSEPRQTSWQIVIHATDDQAAERLGTIVLPKLADRLLQSEKDDSPGWTFQGRPVQCQVLGSDVTITWGTRTRANVVSSDRPPLDELRELLNEHKGIDRVGFSRMDALAAWTGLDAPLVYAMGALEPLVWWGASDANGFRDVFRVSSLKSGTRRAVDRLLETALKEQRP